MRTIPINPNPTKDKIILLHTELEPLVFCQQWFGLHEMSEVKRNDTINEFGFRKRCNQALSLALGLSPNTTRQWGVQFKKMPTIYRARLAQALLYKEAKEALFVENRPHAVIQIARG